MSPSVSAFSIHLFLTARMADKRPSLTKKRRQAPVPAVKPTTTSRPATRSTSKAKKHASKPTEDHDTHENEQQEDLVDKPNGHRSKGKSRAETKKRPRDRTASESEREDSHRRQSARTRTVRMEEVRPTEEERTEERTEESVKVGPPKGKFPNPFREFTSNSAEYRPPLCTHSSPPRPLVLSATTISFPELLSSEAQNPTRPLIASLDFQVQRPTFHHLTSHTPSFYWER